MRKLQLFLAILLIISIGIATYNWLHPLQKSIDPTLPEGSKEAEDQALALTRLLLDQGRAEEALTVIQRYDLSISDITPKGKEWIQLLIEASTNTQDSNELTILWTYFPDSFKNQEKAILLVARNLLANGRTKDYAQLRHAWEGKETLKNEWFFLDADVLSTSKDSYKAINFLESRELPGKEDAERYLRLAIEISGNNPSKDWEYLTKAEEIDPANINVRLYRARFLEVAGRKQNAQAEYTAIVQLDPKNLASKNQLADFYLREGMYVEALTVLSTCLAAPTSDLIWLKTYFWNKVVLALPFDWQNSPIPQGTSTPLLKYLVHLPQGIYWDEAAFEKITDNKAFLRNIQPILWMRVIQKLIDKEEKTAKELLQNSPFTNYSLDPVLEKGLQQILSYKLTKTLQTDKLVVKNPVVGEHHSQNKGDDELFHDLDQAAANNAPLDNNLKSLLDSEESFAAAFLSARWNEAAVALHRLEICPDTFPIWMSLKMAHALHQVKGADAALAFLNQQKPQGVLELLKAQIFLAEANTQEVEKILVSIKSAKGEIGRTATWMLAEIYLEGGALNKAEEILTSRKDLLEETRGQETNARIALANNQIDKAEEIYGKIADKSLEAGSYFATKAFLEGDYEKARELTINLIQQYPANPILRLNLDQIALQQNQKKEQGK